MFPDEPKCREYLEKVRWPFGIICPKCRWNKYLVFQRDFRCPRFFIKRLLLHEDPIYECLWVMLFKTAGKAPIDPSAPERDQITSLVKAINETFLNSVIRDSMDHCGIEWSPLTDALRAKTMDEINAIRYNRAALEDAFPSAFKKPPRGFSKTHDGLYLCLRCKRQISLVSGTMFAGTKDLKAWFKAIWFAVKQTQGIDAVAFQWALGLRSYTTAWAWLQKIRILMKRIRHEPLCGDVQVGIISVSSVHADGKGQGAATIAIAIENNSLREATIRCGQISHPSVEQLEAFLEQVVGPNGHPSGHNWSGLADFRQQASQDTGFASQNLVKLPPRVNVIANKLKLFLSEVYGGSIHCGRLDYYLDEFTFRINAVKARSLGRPFFNLVKEACNTKPMKTSSLFTGQQAADQSVDLAELASLNTTQTPE